MHHGVAVHLAGECWVLQHGGGAGGGGGKGGSWWRGAGTGSCPGVRRCGGGPGLPSGWRGDPGRLPGWRIREKK